MSVAAGIQTLNLLACGANTLTHCATATVLNVLTQSLSHILGKHSAAIFLKSGFSNKAKQISVELDMNDLLNVPSSL